MREKTRFIVSKSFASTPFIRHTQKMQTKAQARARSETFVILISHRGITFLFYFQCFSIHFLSSNRAALFCTKFIIKREFVLIFVCISYFRTVFNYSPLVYWSVRYEMKIDKPGDSSRFISNKHTQKKKYDRLKRSFCLSLAPNNVNHIKTEREIIEERESRFSTFSCIFLKASLLPG